MIKPILFSTPMVEAILAGTKSMTRRVIKPQPVMGKDEMWRWKDCQWIDGGLGFPKSGIEDHAPKKVGDVLWVRETWAKQFGLYWHKAGLEVDENGYCKDGYWQNDLAAPGGKVYIATKAPEKWRPSIYMPKDAARLFLHVTDVRVERLQDISTADCEAEGAGEYGYNIETGERMPTTSVMFQVLWDSINAKRDGGAYTWSNNPWVWVISFERCEKPADFIKEAEL